MDLKEEVPPDFEAIKQNILRGSRYRYNLCFKRRKAESLAGVEFNDSDIISHITIRFSKHEDLPFGYKALTETFYGNPIEFPNSDPFTPLSIIYTRMGAGIIKHISIVTERIENAVPPPGFLMLRRSIYGYPANLNAGSEEKNAWICLYKDYSPLFDFDVIESRPEMKYISPILIATQTLDLGICTKALHYLEILITGGFFESEDSEEDINLNFVANCLVDSLSNSNSAELQDQIVCIMQEFFPSYFRSLTPDVFSLLFLSTYRISSRKNRLGIQREIIHRCIDSLYTSIDPCESNNHVEQHHLCRSIVADLVQHVCDVKLFDETSLEFDSLNLFDPSFILMTQRLVKRFAPQNAILARIMYILLTLIKVGSKGRLYQIDLELQYDSLGLIEQLLSQSLKKYRYLEYNCTLIIRKLLLQSLINNILYQNGTHLSRSLNILKLLLINSFHNCVNELEIVISNILLPLIMNPATDFEKLLMLVDFMMEVFSEKAVFFNIFYNYDNIRGIPLFENMVIVICNLTDKCRLPIDKIPFGWKKHCIQNPQALLQFERGLLDTSILILKGMYDWFRTLFTSKLKINQVNTDDPASYRLSDFDFETFQVIQESNGIVDEHRDRGETVCKRFLKQQARREIFNQAIKMLHEDGKSLKKVISFLISSQYIESNARSIAKWIYERYEVLGLENVGEFLGGTGPIEIEPFEHEVRLSYLRMLDFPTNALDEAMRVILTEGGFRLPAESQKIDRILVDLSEVYYERSGEGFRNKDGVYVLSTAILMLNTSLHNPNVKEKDRLSFEMFLSICKGIEDLIFDEKSLKDIYERIKTDGYSIEFSSTVRLESSEVTSSDDSKSNDISISVLQRNKETERIQRKTLVILISFNIEVSCELT